VTPSGLCKGAQGEPRTQRGTRRKPPSSPTPLVSGVDKPRAPLTGGTGAAHRDPIVRSAEHKPRGPPDPITETRIVSSIGSEPNEFNLYYVKVNSLGGSTSKTLLVPCTKSRSY
jgi:hypothetical protein